MMEMKERYVGKFYASLAEGKLLGQKCRSCGTYRLFPTPVCSNCQGTDMEWVELSGEAKLLFFSIPRVVPARFEPYVPCAVGCIQLKEGPVFWGMVEGIDLRNPAKELARLPIDLHIETKEVAGNAVPIGKVK